MASRVIKDKVVKSKSTTTKIKDKVKDTKLELNDNQKNFCVEYIKALNGTQAYINELIDSYTANVEVTVGGISSQL